MCLCVYASMLLCIYASIYLVICLPICTRPREARPRVLVYIYIYICTACNFVRQCLDGRQRLELRRRCLARERQFMGGLQQPSGIDASTINHCMVSLLKAFKNVLFAILTSVELPFSVTTLSSTLKLWANTIPVTIKNSEKRVSFLYMIFCFSIIKVLKLTQYLSSLKIFSVETSTKLNCKSV